MRLRRVVSVLVGAALATASDLAAAGPPTGPIDPGRSEVEVDVATAGLLSAFGHAHRIVAPVSRGSVVSEGAPRVEIEFDARALRVADAGLSDADREKVQETMEGPEVLDAADHPAIVFRSSGVDAAGGDRWSVAGSLTLRGATRPVRADVSLVDGRYRGSAEFRLSDFGIRPPVAAGGTVRVRDAVRIVFDLAVGGPGA